MLQFLKNQYHLIQAIIAKILYPFPDDKLKVIGVTGTDGKTTTTFLIYHILKSAGKKVSMISTVYAKVGETVYDTGLHVTTPSVFQVYRYLQKSIAAGDEYFVLETTSHALDQNRVWGIPFKVAALTNITHEHLDYHKTYFRYVKAKTKLLKNAEIAIINKDDGSYETVKKLLSHRKKNVITYGLKQNADYQRDLSLKLSSELAEFNKYNYLAAYAVCDKLGIDRKRIISALDTYKLPTGRLEVVYEEDFMVVVDFAHTPNAIHEALKTIKKSITSGRLIHIFGAAGKRDASKRPFMGEASALNADIVILTEEDYRDEDPNKICSEIAMGLEKEGFNKVSPEELKNPHEYTILINRADAVKKALEIVKPGDVIVLTGKGHERSLARGNKEYDWNDKEEVLKLIKSKDKKQ